MFVCVLLQDTFTVFTFQHYIGIQVGTKLDLETFFALSLMLPIFSACRGSLRASVLEIGNLQRQLGPSSKRRS